MWAMNEGIERQVTTLTSNIMLDAPSIANGTVLAATGSGDITLKIDSLRFAGRISLYSRCRGGEERERQTDRSSRKDRRRTWWRTREDRRSSRV